MIRNTFITIIAATALSAPAFAAPPKENGFFLGAAIGSTELDDDGAYSGFALDDKDSSVTFSAGYKFVRFFGIEARVADLGTYTVSNGFFSESAEVSSVSVHAVGYVPFGQSGWELYGQLGLGTVDFDCVDCGEETVGSAGIGLRYSFAQKLAVGVQIDAYAWQEDAYYDFSIGTTQLVIQYLF